MPSLAQEGKTIEEANEQMFKGYFWMAQGHDGEIT